MGCAALLHWGPPRLRTCLFSICICIVFEMRRPAWRFVLPRAGTFVDAVRRPVLHARAIIALVFVFVFALDRGRCPRNFPLDSSASARVDGALGCSLILAMTPLWVFLFSQDKRAWGALLRLSQRCAQRASSYVAGLTCVNLYFVFCIHGVARNAPCHVKLLRGTRFVVVMDFTPVSMAIKVEPGAEAPSWIYCMSHFAPRNV
jgi:hypothetical protein